MHTHIHTVMHKNYKQNLDKATSGEGEEIGLGKSIYIKKWNIPFFMFLWNYQNLSQV